MMRKPIRSLAVASATTLLIGLTYGCTHANLPASAPTDDGTTFGGAIDQAKKIAAEAPATAVDGSDGLFAERGPGDFVVYRFSGSYRKKPLLLREEVVARDGGLFVIDYTSRESALPGATEGKVAGETLRVHFNAGIGAKVEVLEVEKIVDGKETPALPADFDTMMGKTILAVDDNEATTAIESLDLDVGGTKLACEKTSYRVRVGAAAATMIVTQSKDFPWGDVAAEIVTKSGDVLYRAEVLSAGSAKSESSDPSIGY
jgi:hypothetical protein